MAEKEFSDQQRSAAYAAAKQKIAEGVGQGLILSAYTYPIFYALDRLPDEVAELDQLRLLQLHGTQVTDLTPLAGLSNLQTLDLDGTQVTDLTPLAGLSNLRELYLSGTQVTDLTPLADLSNLQELDLSETQVSDLTPVISLPKLQNLIFDGSHVTEIPTPTGDTMIAGLNLTGMPIQNVDFIRRMPNLKKLNLGRTPVMMLNPDLAKVYRSASGGKRVNKIREWLDTQEPDQQADPAADPSPPPPVLSAKWGKSEDGSPQIQGWGPTAEDGRTTLDAARQKGLMEAAASSAGFLKEEAENNRAHPQIAVRLADYQTAVDKEPDAFIPNTADTLAAIIGGLIADNEDTPHAVAKGFESFQHTHRQMLFHFPAFEDFETAVDQTALEPDDVPPDFAKDVKTAIEDAHHMFGEEIHQALAAIERKVDAVADGNEAAKRIARKSYAIALVSIAASLFSAASADLSILGANAAWAQSQIAPVAEALRKALDMVRELFANWKL